MHTFEEFEGELREALTHLYDPIYEPTPLLRSVVQSHSAHGTESVQELVKQAIERLSPDEDVPVNARSRRIYELLRSRYVRELTQEETANRLGISPRHLRREQQQAVHLLAQRLWEQRSPSQSLAAHNSFAAAVDEPRDPGPWRSQVHQELAALDRSDPNAVAVVADAVQHVQRLEQSLPNGCRIVVVDNPAKHDLTVSIHPSLLRQLLLVTVQKLRDLAQDGTICIETARRGESVALALSADTHAAIDVLPQSDFVREVLDAVSGTVQVFQRHDSVTVEITLPYSPGITVLVVEDNSDLVHFYRRYTDRTRYRIAHICEGTQVFAAVESLDPSIIVLDVMLSDMDGWEILTLLHSTARTRSIPIIVCSVVRQEELALGLGASLYISKPVGRQDFIQALDQVLPLATAARPTIPANSAEVS